MQQISQPNSKTDLFYLLAKQLFLMVISHLSVQCNLKDFSPQKNKTVMTLLSADPMIINQLVFMQDLHKLATNLSIRQRKLVKNSHEIGFRFHSDNA